MTAGAAASLTITLRAVSAAGEEVIVFTPYFPEYKVFIENGGAAVREVPVRADDFQIDFAALEAAFSEKTAALIVNSPNNPTGAILSAETLAALGDFLRGKEALYGKEIYLISDEPYREIVYDGCRAAFPADYYDDTIICYSYSKSLSLPGERIGYILVSPRAGSCADLFAAICGAGRSLGYVCAPSLLQRVVAGVRILTFTRRIAVCCLRICKRSAIRSFRRRVLFTCSLRHRTETEMRFRRRQKNMSCC